MSKDWTPKQLQAASQAMKEAGHLSYEEFCEELDQMEYKTPSEHDISYSAERRANHGKELL